MGQTAVDQPLDDPLTEAWQLSLTGWDIRAARLDRVSGVSMLTSSVDGVLALGAAPPDLLSDVCRWHVPVQVVGPSYPGQLMAIDKSGMVYRLSPGQAPTPVWRSTYHPDDLDGVDGLPGGRLLVGSVDFGTEMVEESTGQTVWRSRIPVVPVMPVDDQLIGQAGPTSGDLVSLDVRTGAERWRQPRALWAASGIFAVVGGVLWATDSIHNQVAGFSVDSGRPVATVELPRKSRLTGLVDQAGNLHIGDERGWLIVDLSQARVAADVRFAAAGIGGVYAKRTVRSADGRLMLADDQGQIFMVHPTQPEKPRLVVTCPAIKGIGISAGRLIVLSFDGTLTALGTPA
jgi:hypothetical protein